ncbi:hypothetical protein POJ06DRAFT_248047 [Lipomyces tetrasporus]|uniref:DUF914-domain-containing protein n=1 Tax=Lipomyces tetrasporus TaxID=54092 RepID=A0AAD7QXX7_9ASCO|nr:uncharacterized protein POJ06DRAFT_248047 [Lipomyces tetrasporus]KAJ8101852.1 hypothetical protein POJ06DRAFT_248047 [Lipomyces tetrasporus]
MSSSSNPFSNGGPYINNKLGGEDDLYGSVELSKPITTSESSNVDGETTPQLYDDQDVEDVLKPKPFQFLFTSRFWIILFHGQILSLCIVATNTFSSYLAADGNNVPAFQTLFNYVILNLVFTPYTVYRYGVKRYFKNLYYDGWKFFILAFADVEGNYFVVKAYQYTNLLSAQLLDNWAIAVVVVLSFLFLKVRYRWNQVVGIIVCIAGMVLVVIGDLLTDKNYVAVDMVKGDLFVLLGATCYGISNTLEEFLVSKRPIYEVLGQMGLFGMIINGVQAAIFERESIKEAHWGGRIAGWFTGYTLAMLVLYCTAPILFRMSSAAFYNLSLLTSDFWGLLIGIKVFGYYVFWLYPVGFVFTVSGMIVYNSMVRSLKGEAEKPWLGADQRDGIAGVGTAKTKNADPSEENMQSEV